MRRSKLLTFTLKEAPKEERSINSQLLIRAGFIDRLMAGVYSFLPLGYRVLGKIESIIRQEMLAIGSQEILLPALQPREIWEKTGRWGTLDVLFRFKGSGDRDLTLGPTHEEVVTPLIGKFILSYKDLPTSVFQIQTKFRDEARPKAGLLRGREFRMKDMYSFHAAEADLDQYYEKVKQAYVSIFNRCGIGSNTHLTYASGGAFSKYSHEYQTVTEHGEDLIYLCGACQIAVNREILADQNNRCPECGSVDLQPKKAIEVGNIFKLMDRFSSAFDVQFRDENDTNRAVYMGCYGIGPSRLMGAVVEVHHDEKGIIWPDELSPFEVYLINLSPDFGEAAKADALYRSLIHSGVDVLYDDRDQMSAGIRFAEADLIGIPTRFVLSSRTLSSGSVEVKSRREKGIRLVPLDLLMSEPQKILRAKT